MNRMTSRAAQVPGIILIITASIGFADDAEMARWTIDSGGVTRSTSGSYELSGTIGQPDAGGTMAGGDWTLTGGFWFGLAPGDCNTSGCVDLLDHEEFESCLAGPDVGTPAGCECFDVNRSDTVDLRDFAAAQAAFTGS